MIETTESRIEQLEYFSFSATSLFFIYYLLTNQGPFASGWAAIILLGLFFVSAVIFIFSGLGIMGAVIDRIQIKTINTVLKFIKINKNIFGFIIIILINIVLITYLKQGLSYTTKEIIGPIVIEILIILAIHAREINDYFRNKIEHNLKP